MAVVGVGGLTGSRSSQSRTGLALSDQQFQAEADEHYRRRLRVFLGVTLIAAAALYVVAQSTRALVSGVDRIAFLGPASLVHLAVCVALALLMGLLRKRAHPHRTLLAIDATGLGVTIAGVLAIYAIDYREGVRTLVALLAIFLVARAVVVPNRARFTFFISLPAAIGFLAIELAYGTGWYAPGIEHTRGQFLAVVVLNQTIMWFALAVATVSSKVTHSLGKEIQQALRLGQYRLEDKVGEGAMGEVYRATHAMLRRPTAIKLLRPEITGVETMRRFEIEVRQLSRLSHPNTVSIYDYGHTADGVLYYAMEYLDGADLATLVRETGSMPPARVIHLLAQVCGSLAEAHDTGLVHRDIKPSNIFVCNQGGLPDVVKVVDFGLVKDLHAPELGATQTGEICGTPETLAPEVIRGEPATPLSDIYSLSAVGYHLLTAHYIFDADTTLEFLSAHLHAEPVPPRDRDPSVPDDIASVVLKGLSKDPGQRQPSAVAFRTELERCADAGKWGPADAARWWEQRSAVS